MKRTKERTGAKVSKKASPVTKRAKPVDLAEIRQQITNLVGNDAIGMVETTIEEVGKGHYLGTNYLFVLVGLYPTTAAEGELVPDSMAATLLRRLGLPEAPMPEEKVTKDRETPTAVSEDGLE